MGTAARRACCAPACRATLARKANQLYYGDNLEVLREHIADDWDQATARLFASYRSRRYGDCMKSAANNSGIGNSAGATRPSKVSLVAPETGTQIAAARKVMARRKRALQELAK